MTSPDDKTPDLSGYDRNVRGEKFPAAPTAAEREANDRFFDPTVEPLTREETVLGWKFMTVVAVVLVVIVAFAVEVFS